MNLVVVEYINEYDEFVFYGVYNTEDCKKALKAYREQCINTEFEKPPIKGNKQSAFIDGYARAYITIAEEIE